MEEKELDGIKKRLLTLEEQIARVDPSLLNILTDSWKGDGPGQGKCGCGGCPCPADTNRSSKVGEVQAVRDC